MLTASDLLGPDPAKGSNEGKRRRAFTEDPTTVMFVEKSAQISDPIRTASVSIEASPEPPPVDELGAARSIFWWGVAAVLFWGLVLLATSAV